MAAPDVRKGEFVNIGLSQLRALRAVLEPCLQAKSDEFWNLRQFVGRLDDEISRRTS
jgi:hypothetical protein